MPRCKRQGLSLTELRTCRQSALALSSENPLTLPLRKYSYIKAIAPAQGWPSLFCLSALSHTLNISPCTPYYVSAVKYRFILFFSCCALISDGMLVWCTTCGRYTASTGGILFTGVSFGRHPAAQRKLTSRRRLGGSTRRACPHHPSGSGSTSVRVPPRSW